MLIFLLLPYLSPLHTFPVSPLKLCFVLRYSMPFLISGLNNDSIEYFTLGSATASHLLPALDLQSILLGGSFLPILQAFGCHYSLGNIHSLNPLTPSFAKGLILVFATYMLPKHHILPLSYTITLPRNCLFNCMSSSLYQ